MKDLFDKRVRGLKTVDRIYLPRVAGLLLGALPVASVYLETGAPAHLWALMLLYALVWPHAARWRAARSADPYRAELKNMVADALALGWVVATIGFSLLPTALLLTMMTMGILGMAGRNLLLRAAPGYILGALVGWLVTGVEPNLESSRQAIVASLPMLTLYPLMIGGVTYLQAKKLVAQQKELAAALAEIRTLKGLLPICSHCKNIRDDHGSWRHMEEYISERSDAVFSHSICPECMEVHYPEYKRNNRD